MGSFGIIHWIILLFVLAFWVGVFMLIARLLQRRNPK